MPRGGRLPDRASQSNRRRKTDGRRGDRSTARVG